MFALIITGGSCPEMSRLKSLARNAELIVAADSGLEAAVASGIWPHVSVGDFDSIENLALLDGIQAAALQKFPEDKDETDTEIAIRTALDRGAKRITIAGGGGGRLDHTIAIFNLFKRELPLYAWHTAQESAFHLKPFEMGEFKVSPQATISVFALSDQSGGMRSTGLHWPLDSLSWGAGGFGISNRASGVAFTIQAGTSGLLVILPPYGERIE